jgi:hypothetical protein
LTLSIFRSRNAGIAAATILLIAISLLFLLHKEENVKLLYATAGEAYDSSAFGDFEQSLQANLRLERKSLHELSTRKLGAYDAIYLDPKLMQDVNLKADIPKLMSYVQDGGHLFLENSFATNFPAGFLGAEQVVKVPAVTGIPGFTYPNADVNLSGMQQVFRLFSESYFKRTKMEDLPGFDWGYGLVPSTARTIVGLDHLALSSVNQIGSGTVLLSSAFMPNRYFATGYDLQSGMDPAQGFTKLTESYNQSAPLLPGTAYFNKRALPLEPYFDFTFAAANTEFRSAYVGFVSKLKLGYSIKKILGPNGRPAMAFQNHFEALPSIGQQDGIQWAELLKTYNQIPSFTLVRSSFTWGQWRESLTTQLNVGTNEQPQFVGELPGSGYSSGLHLLSGGTPLRLAIFPQYRDLASAIELPYRAYPALADLDGDSRLDLLAGSADGFVYAYTNLGPNQAAYPPSEPLPRGAAPPDTFGEARKLELESGAPLQLQPYAAIHASDVNGDGLPDLIVGDESGAVRLLPGRGGGRFGPPAALSAGGGKLQVQVPAAVDVADVNGDGVRDLVVGDGDGRVHLFAGIRGGDVVRFAADKQLLKLPAEAQFAAPSVRDMNGDGRVDLVIGSNEGDLQLYLQEADGSWKNQGPLQGVTLNQVGNKALVAGHNSVPLWYDINHDGKDDLIVGGVEFGSPVAIDDPKFPYQKELKAFINYAHDHFLELDPHLFVHNFKSDEQEREEIALHKKAFDTLGIPWNHPGTNQHTWRINYPDRLQSLRNEQDQGIWFNFGFFPAHSPVVSRPVSIWSLPFLLADKDHKSGTPMLLHTPTPVLNVTTYPSTDIFESMAKLDMPIDYFEHIEYHFPVPAKIADLTEFAAYFDKLRSEQDYNFITEKQMAQSFLTAMKGEVTVSKSWASFLWDKLKDRVAGVNPHWNAKLTPNVSLISEQAGAYVNTLGVEIEKGNKFYSYSLSTDSDVYLQREGSFYVGLSNPTSVHIGPDDNRLHVLRSNVPFQTKHSRNELRIDLQASGMQQIKIFSQEAVVIEGPDLKIDAHPENHTYTVTHYGDQISITVKPAESH